MILKGNQRAGGDDLASHLLNLYDNDDVELAQVRGTVAQDLHGAFAEFEAMASGTRAREALYSLSINPAVPMSREQYAAAIDRIEERLGLSGQPRAVVFHWKAGADGTPREHCHVVWSRIDVTQMKAVQLSHDRQKLRVCAQELAREFGHDLPGGLRNDRGGERFEASPGLTAADLALADRSGLSAEDRRRDITSAYREAKDAQSFIDGLWLRGYQLARGDQRGFVVVDRAMHVHSLSRQVVGASAKEVRAMLAPLIPQDLPGVKEARARIGDQLETEALDDGPKPHLRRSPEKLKARQAKRRAALASEWQDTETAWREERLALHTAQQRERERPFARAAMAVLALLDRTPVLRTVLAPYYKNPKLNIEERHKQENEALERRYERERRSLERRQNALSRVEARENKSLARDQRRIQGAAYDEAVQRGSDLAELRENAADITQRQGGPSAPKEKEAPSAKQNRPRGLGLRPS